MTPVIVTSATLLVVIAVLAALFPPTAGRAGRVRTVGVATAASIGNHCVCEWPERQGERHTAPVRRVDVSSSPSCAPCSCSSPAAASARRGSAAA